ncbi:hypothetical protein GTW25_15915 [Aliihoeflea aestuarii]|nr:hypothetical protein [Aliihoeflea aestuarii]
MWPSASSNRYLNISRTRRIVTLSAGISFLPKPRPKGGTIHQQSTGPKHRRRGRHHLGIRGRLILGTRGRHHFGIGGRLPSEFAVRWKKSMPCGGSLMLKLSRRFA